MRTFEHGGLIIKEVMDGAFQFTWHLGNRYLGVAGIYSSLESGLRAVLAAPTPVKDKAVIVEQIMLRAASTGWNLERLCTS